MDFFGYNVTLKDMYIVLAVLFVMIAGSILNRMVDFSKYRHIPPGWVFGLVWTLLYIGYAVSWIYTYRMIQNKSNLTQDERNALEFKFDILFTTGLFLNLLWSLCIVLNKTSADVCLVANIVFALLIVYCISYFLGKEYYLILYFVTLGVWQTIAFTLSVMNSNLNK